MFSRFAQRSCGVASIGLVLLFFYIARNHPKPRKVAPGGEVCSLVIVDLERLYDEASGTVPAMEDLLSRLTQRRPKLRFGVAVTDAGGPGQFEELRSPLYEEIFDDEEPERLKERLPRSRQSSRSSAGNGVFVAEALDWAERRIDGTDSELSSCRRWELFLLTTAEPLEVPPDLAAMLPHRLNRFCPLTTRIVLFPGLAAAPDSERAQSLAEQIRRVAPHCLWSDFEEYQAMQELTRHMVLVDVSGSVRSRESDERKIVEWFNTVYSGSILPSVQARMPLYPDQDFEVSIFGSRIVHVQAAKSASVMTTPRISPRQVKEADPSQTSLAVLFAYLKDQGSAADSVWLYTDGVDDPLAGDVTLAELLAQWSCNGAEAPTIGRWLYLQLPAGLEGMDDSNVQRVRQAAECLGYRVVEASGPPAVEALAVCGS